MCTHGQETERIIASQSACLLGQVLGVGGEGGLVYHEYEASSVLVSICTRTVANRRAAGRINFKNKIKWKAFRSTICLAILQLFYIMLVHFFIFFNILP